ncbi:thiamine biosynthesis protein ApbE [Desulfonema ishimotonii]|uniref:Thiamine biosynthesis protein ApbE n=1 Tax=Desulfonema ishimotonii TaxID=45657 RepID=A0A401FTV4_9BACT|nr:UPF0280 family protein [Desulfonema ishimotonii]GBC60385.1 thiamine biosynthesis protein ApbE [Desulfonema ishimotonii]
MHQKRTYRNLIDSGRRAFFNVTVKETDLYIHAPQTPENTARDLVLKYRGYIEAYIRQYPEFASTLTPWHISGPAPAIIRDMADAGQKAGVGPMAAVAGAMSEYVGRDLLERSREVIVENGGDVFVKADAPTTIALFAGNSP